MCVCDINCLKLTVLGGCCRRLSSINLHRWSFARVIHVVLWLAAVCSYWFPCVQISSKLYAVRSRCRWRLFI